MIEESKNLDRIFPHWMLKTCGDFVTETICTLIGLGGLLVYEILLTGLAFAECFFKPIRTHVLVVFCWCTVVLLHDAVCLFLLILFWCVLVVLVFIDVKLVQSKMQLLRTETTRYVGGYERKTLIFDGGLFVGGGDLVFLFFYQASYPPCRC